MIGSRPKRRPAGLGLIGGLVVGLSGLIATPALGVEAQATIQIVGTRCLTNDDEVITIQNRGNQSQLLAGWTLEDNQGNRFLLPGGFSLGPARIVRVHVGPASPPNSATDRHWTDSSGAPRIEPLWDDTGDSAILRDAAGRVVSQAACEIGSAPPANGPGAAPATAPITPTPLLATATPAVEMPAWPPSVRPDSPATPESGGVPAGPPAGGTFREPSGQPQLLPILTGTPGLQGAQFRPGEHVTIGMQYEAVSNQTAVASQIVTADSGGAFVAPLPFDVKPGSSFMITASGDRGSRGAIVVTIPAAEPASAAAAGSAWPAAPIGAAPVTQSPEATEVTPAREAAPPPPTATPAQATQATRAATSPPAGSEAGAPAPSAATAVPPAATPRTTAATPAAVPPRLTTTTTPATSGSSPPSASPSGGPASASAPSASSAQLSSRPGASPGVTPFALPRTGSPPLAMAGGAAALSSLIVGWALRRARGGRE